MDPHETGRAMGDFGPGDPTYVERPAQLHQYSERKTCPLCGAPIVNKATTCHACREAWQQIGGDLDAPSAQEQMMAIYRQHQAMLDAGGTIQDVIADIKARKRARQKRG